MKKLTKKERAEKYLKDLTNAENFGLEQLDKMTVYDLLDTPELKGIGKTTLSGALKSLKKKRGLKKDDKKKPEKEQKEKIERYLIKLMNMENFTLQDLMDLSVYDLLGNAELEGIGKTTLSEVINSFKKTSLKKRNDENKTETDIKNVKAHDKNANLGKDRKESDHKEYNDAQKLFEDAFIHAIEEEEEQRDKKGNEKNKREDKYEVKLKEADFNILKEMLHEYKKLKNKVFKQERQELSELKHALKYFGINYKKIVKQYRKLSKSDD